MQNVFFTSDTHFNHENIIRFAKRPFLNKDDMIRGMTYFWNNKVGANDIVYHLGDFALGGDKDLALQILKSLNGHIHFIEGNHDSVASKFKDQFASYNEGFIERKIMGQRIVMCHYAMKVWHKSHHGSWHLYGHSHGTMPDDPNSLSIDVGVDCHNYAPISFEEVKLIMSKKYFVSVDHHSMETT